MEIFNVKKIKALTRQVHGKDVEFSNEPKSTLENRGKKSNINI
ncbi:small, acid-soluble spore protein L [Neobacillus thermocopriae]|nr:small, acid-soluble spore protein L [Neobacillus thermocopriae]MED3714913.1 small, acid-soluble spore protein L [Neobacillus thermocopriae]